MPAFQESRSPFSPVTLYVSSREPRLRLAILAAFAPLPVTSFMITQAPADWWQEPLGAAGWWVLPTLLVGLSALLPWAVSRLHDRYVLRLERTPEGRWVLTTLILWGLRTREVAPHGLVRAGKVIQLRDGPPLIFDRRGEFPLGRDALGSRL